MKYLHGRVVSDISNQTNKQMVPTITALHDFKWLVHEATKCGTYMEVVVRSTVMRLASHAMELTQ